MVTTCSGSITETDPPACLQPLIAIILQRKQSIQGHKHAETHTPPSSPSSRHPHLRSQVSSPHTSSAGLLPLTEKRLPCRLWSGWCRLMRHRRKMICCGYKCPIDPAECCSSILVIPRPPLPLGPSLTQASGGPL